MVKIKVGFEITDNWNKADFREFIYLLLENDNYELYVISNNDTSAYILSVGAQLGLPSNRVIITNFTPDKVQAIVDNNIDIYFDNIQMTVLIIQETTDCEAILVNELPNRYQSKTTWYVNFERVIKQIKEENCGKDENCCSEGEG